MRKRLKAVSLLVTASLLCGLLSGCGGSARSTASSAAAEEEDDLLLAWHQEQLDYLNSTYKANHTASSQNVEFHLYYDDTQSMLGFVQADNGQNTFVNMLDEAVDCAKSMLNDGFSELKAFTLVDEVPGDGRNQELNWTEIDIIGSLQAQFMRSDFYTGGHTNHRDGTLNRTDTGAQAGPLARLFMDGNNPFATGAVTVVVTDLREQGFNVDDLVDALLTYQNEEPTAEICIMACTSDYTGTISIPVYSNSNTGTDIVSIDNYEGPAAYYYIVAGPAQQVDQYTGALQDKLQCDDLVCASFEDQTASQGEPLRFSLVKNTMEGKRTDDLLPGNISDSDDVASDSTSRREQPASSPETSRKRIRTTSTTESDAAVRQIAVTSMQIGTALAQPLRSTKRGSGSGSLTVSPYIDQVWGSANVKVTEGEASRNGAFSVLITPNMGDGKSEAFGAVSLISAYADLPDGTQASAAKTGADQTYWANLSGVQLYQKVDGNWVAADDAALSSIQIRFETVDGPLTEYNSTEVLLKSNRHTGYLRVMVDNTEGAFDPEQTYLLSVPIHTSMKSDMVSCADQLLEEYNADTKAYTQALQALTKHGDRYSFDTSTEEAMQQAKEQFARTPKLDIIVQQLRNSLNTKVSSDVQFVDFVLSAPQNEGRSRG